MPTQTARRAIFVDRPHRAPFTGCGCQILHRAIAVSEQGIDGADPQPPVTVLLQRLHEPGKILQRVAAHHRTVGEQAEAVNRADPDSAVAGLQQRIDLVVRQAVGPSSRR